MTLEDPWMIGPLTVAAIVFGWGYYWWVRAAAWKASDSEWVYRGIGVRWHPDTDRNRSKALVAAIDACMIGLAAHFPDKRLDEFWNWRIEWLPYDGIIGENLNGVTIRGTLRPDKKFFWSKPVWTVVAIQPMTADGTDGLIVCEEVAHLFGVVLKGEAALLNFDHHHHDLWVLACKMKDNYRERMGVQ